MRPYWLRWLHWHAGKKNVASPAKRAAWDFEQLARRLTPNDVAIDCGANLGFYTEMLAHRGARVFAFEPDPLAFEQLRERCRPYPNVTLVPKAVGAKADTAVLYRTKDFDTNPLEKSQSSSLLSFKPNLDLESGIAVEQIDLVDFIRALDRPVTILKIDIEGAEFDLLDALIKAGCMEKVRHTFVETHDHKIPGLEEAGRRLRALIAERGLTGINLDWR